MTDRPRIGLVVHYSDSNYGNHLVNFASRRILEHCGYRVDVLVFERARWREIGAALRRLPTKAARIGVHGARERVSRRIRRLRASPASQHFDARLQASRVARFREFSAAYIQPKFHDVAHRRELARAYAKFAIGSDQIWNYEYRIGPWHFLDFAGPGDTVCLSPSVGHDAIPREWLPFYRRNLSRFAEVGVRELKWTESLPPWPSRPRFELQIDPTLVLAVEEWAQIAAPASTAAPHLLLYELGALSERHRAFVEEIADTYGLKVLRLAGHEPDSAWETNAADFLGMVWSASCIVTDSYHGAIFAFLFDKPLVMIPRHGSAGAMNSRIETLAKEFHLSNRLIDAMNLSDVMDHDYSAGRAALERRRGNFWAYLSRHGLSRVPAFRDEPDLVEDP